MLAIKASTVDERSSPNSPNLYGKVNKTFAHWFAHFNVKHTVGAPLFFI